MANVPSGMKHTAIITNDGKVQVWGRYIYGQHGNCAFNSAPSLVLFNPDPLNINEITFCNNSPTPLTDVIKLENGDAHVLALLCDNTLVAWGNNENKQLGNTNFTTNRSIYAIPVESSPTVTLMNISEIGAGRFSSLAVDNDGYAYYWGASLSSLAAAATPNSGSATPEKLRISSSVLLTEVMAVDAGANHFLVMMKNGTVMTYGNNGSGQLGVNPASTFSSIYAIQVQKSTGGPLTGIVAISAGDGFNLALDVAGDVYAWGANGSGQLGLGTNTIYEYSATKITTLSGIVSIAAGHSHSVCVKNNNNVYSWGYNYYYQCGQTFSSNSENTPLLVTLPVGASDVYSAIAGERHSLVFSKGGQIYGLGR